MTRTGTGAGIRTGRAVKGALVAALAAVVCHSVWSALRDRAHDASSGGQGAMGAGWLDGLLAGVCGVVAMPLLLWAGMRLLRERGNHLLVVGGAVAWLPIGGHLVEDSVSGPARVLFLALFALLGGALALAEVPKR